MTMTDLPALDGSDKQVAWATKIRAETLALPGNKIRTTPEKPFNAQQIELAASVGMTEADLRAAMRRIADAEQKALGILTAQTSAVWWIDNRNAAVATTAVYTAFQAVYRPLMAKLNGDKK